MRLHSLAVGLHPTLKPQDSEWRQASPWNACTEAVWPCPALGGCCCCGEAPVEENLPGRTDQGGARPGGTNLAVVAAGA